eukprot:GILK01007569.1.p1 GENE.GILK01007569.1~~GILK01007569.1.p1  ORF type:complete len:394 (-),score=32.83 GILK01007569.1:68-1168(-)
MESTKPDAIGISPSRKPFRIEKRHNGVERPLPSPLGASSKLDVIQYPQYSSALTRLLWSGTPSRVLIVIKPSSDDHTEDFLAIVKWLGRGKKLQVYVEPFLFSKYESSELPLLTWSNEEEAQDVKSSVDFIVALGGDGTLLWISTLFGEAVPPVIPFAQESFGFMTCFHPSDHRTAIEQVLQGGFSITLRSRLSCVLHDSTTAQSHHLGLALNEVVLDRGPSSYLTSLDCFADDTFITNVQADGLIIATPTGSTAYSMSAGGSIIHPSVPGILFTPVCPHSLSFRPLLFPDSVTLRVEVPEDARHNAWVSLDGREKQEVKKGDYLLITTSSWPLPAVSSQGDLRDWFTGVIHNLSWNTRVRQKALL